MRRVVSVSCLLVLVGCAGPHSTGALWAQQNQDQELISGRQTDAQRAAQMHAYELTLADESLAAERARIGLAMQDCPGGTQHRLELSVGDRVRDSIRLRVGDDAQRQAAVAQVALADWRVRRAAATSEAHFCAEARQTLAASPGGDGIPPESLNNSPGGQPTAEDPLAGLGSATVTRDPRDPGDVPDQTATLGPSEISAVSLSLSNYALGYVDAVRAHAPLPQYLAAVYGGVLIDVDRPPASYIQVAGPNEHAGTPEDVVDLLAPAHPQWEPDAIYAVLRPT